MKVVFWLLISALIAGRAVYHEQIVSPGWHGRGVPTLSAAPTSTARDHAAD